MPLSEDLVENGSSDIFALKYPKHGWSMAINEISQAVLSAD